MNVKTSHLLLFGLVLYAVTSLFFLTDFPFVHSDEAWLAGLSQTMITENTLKTTESFFDLYPRYPHAVKILFNGIQIFFIKLLGFRIFTLRLISWCFAMGGLVLFFDLMKTLTRKKGLALTLTLALMFNIQFIYMSHMARQEAVLFFIMLLNLTYLHKARPASPVVSGLISGLAIGLHPNSFLIFMPVFAYWLLGRDFKKILLFIGTTGSLALAFVLFSLALDPKFIPHYFNYGSELGVGMSLFDKLLQMKPFYQKLYYGVSGTYYTPDIRGFFLIFGAGTLLNAWLVIRRRISPFPLLALFMLHLGLVLVGRYNQTSIIFTLPLYLGVLGLALARLNHRGVTGLVLGLVLVYTGFSAWQNIDGHFYSQTYDAYLEEISDLLPPDARVLGNLNALFAFNPENFYDYRNLDHLQEDTTFEDYIRERGIEYILYPEEMDFIYEKRPLWNDLYGNLHPYYHQMKTFLEEECTLAASFESPVYGMRIVRYIEDRPYEVKVYQVK